MKKNNHSRGTTMIEMLIYAALLGIFLYSLTNLFIASIDLRLETEANSTVEQDSRFIIARMRYDITHADTIVTPNAPGGQGASLSLTRGGVNYTYSVDGNGDFLITSGGTSDQLNSSETEITAINFRRLGGTGFNNSITVSFTNSSRTFHAGSPETRSYDVTYTERGL